MTILALSLVLLAALTHASWNIYAKVAAESRHFVWLFSAGSVLIYGPVVFAVLIVERPVFEGRHWLALAATSVLHLLYSLSLQTGYRHSDLSVVYPIARGTGPLLSFIGAGLLLGEALTAQSVAGLALIVGGILLVAGLIGHHRRAPGVGVFYGLLDDEHCDDHRPVDEHRAGGKEPHEMARFCCDLGVDIPACVRERRQQHETERKDRHSAI